MCSLSLPAPPDHPSFPGQTRTFCLALKPQSGCGHRAPVVPSEAQSWVPSESVCSRLEMPVVRNMGLTLAPAVFKALCVARESEVLRQGGRCVRRWTGAQLEGRLVPLDVLRSETGTSWHLGWSVPSHPLGLCSPSLSFSACFLSAPALISLLSIYLFSPS